MAEPAAILVVDDEAGVRHALERALGKAGYEVTTAASGEDALRQIQLFTFDLALIDLKMPGMGGLAFLQELRQRSPQTVAIILTAHATLDSAIQALRLGAHDYLLKPFSLDDLLRSVREGLGKRQREIRVNALIRQLERDVATLRALQGDAGPLTPAETVSSQPRPLEVGPFRIDRDQYRAFMHGRPLDLTPTEFEILACLVERAPAVVSPQELVRDALGYRAEPYEARDLIKWHIHHLRKKVEPDPTTPQYIVTVRGVGYTLAIE